MALDATVGSMPYLLIHGVWFMLFSATYLLWSWINYAANIGNAHGDRFIYDYLNWGDPSGARALGLVIVLMISPIVNFIFWASVNLMNELALQRRSDGPGADTRATVAQGINAITLYGVDVAGLRPVALRARRLAHAEVVARSQGMSCTLELEMSGNAVPPIMRILRHLSGGLPPCGVGRRRAACPTVRSVLFFCFGEGVAEQQNGHGKTRGAPLPLW